MILISNPDNAVTGQISVLFTVWGSANKNTLMLSVKCLDPGKYYPDQSDPEFVLQTVCLGIIQGLLMSQLKDDCINQHIQSFSIGHVGLGE